MKLFALLFLSALAAPAATVFISSYNITDAALSGYGGGWSHTYNGTITPGGSFVGAGGTGTAATYTGGSGTLNDGVIAYSVTDNQLFDAAVLNPVITRAGVTVGRGGAAAGRHRERRGHVCRWRMAVDGPESGGIRG